MLHRMALIGAMALFVTIAACRTMTMPPGQLEIDRIAIVGHGIAFDRNMRAIPMDLRTIESMQGSLRDALGRSSRFGGQDGGFTANITAAIAANRSPEERALLTGALINWQLERAGRQVLETYGWRNRFLTERTRALLDRRGGGRYDLSEALRRLLRDGGLIFPAVETGYMSECRAQSVPVPPNFSMTTPGAWVNRGDLTYNILNPGMPAQVWTWTDPARVRGGGNGGPGARGACVALPRDDGEPGSFAGIICQSATTGRACFWDNLTRADPTRRVPPATETMVISELQDGRTLDEGEPCTGCHTGNNVFLMSPDDETWAQLMRPPLPAGNFTTIFEPQADTVAGGPRYTPIAHASWTNPALASGCSGVCHGAPSAAVQRRWSELPVGQRPPMPPACATPGGFRNCYR
jgi:hypothetical protein